MITCWIAKSGKSDQIIDRWIAVCHPPVSNICARVGLYIPGFCFNALAIFFYVDDGLVMA